MTRSVRIRPTSKLESGETRAWRVLDSAEIVDDFWTRYLVRSSMTCFSCRSRGISMAEKQNGRFLGAYSVLVQVEHRQEGIRISLIAFDLHRRTQ
jgi:hypothetical protein